MTNPMNTGTEMRSRIVDRGKVPPQPQNMVRCSNELYNEQRMVRQQARENSPDKGFVDNWGGGVTRVAGKFAVDDGVLADLVDLDPLGEQFDTWMGMSSQMSEFALACGQSRYLPLPPANSQPPSMLYANVGLPEFLQTLQQETMSGPVAGSCNISQMLQMSEPMLGMEDRSVSLQSSGEGEKSGLSEEEQLAEPDRSRSKSRAMAMTRAVPASLPPLSLLRDQLVQAVRLIGRLRPDTLVQAWVPVCMNGSSKRVLTTREQPYALEHKNHQLWVFRTVSESFEFAAEEGDASRVAGVPGRVFVRQVAEWSPNVQLYSSLEYPRWKEAQRCDIRGSLAVPVFDPSSHDCVAVIELVGRAEKVQFGPDVDIVVRAVQVPLSLLPACVVPISGL